ncbi:MAG TPA: diguanylate cyclase [Pirellulales bacterium]|nr:diguanylate cyclase [Pirellulales bacterium]
MEPLVLPTDLPCEAALSLGPPCDDEASQESQLVQARLGVASSLFAALRCKHAPTAAHSLRVALGCSSWAFALGLHDSDRDELEIAALLHDIGKIGTPDTVLLKPGPLAREEAGLMDQYRRAGTDILASSCVAPAILEIIRHAPTWYDGSHPFGAPVGSQIPLGARMLSIVDAFDSMTCDQIYRRAMSRERALNELFRHAGVQFDPDLVKSFAELQITPQLHRKVVGHWLQAIDARQASRYWRHVATTVVPQAAAPSDPQVTFQNKLLDNMYDAVIFVDCNLEIVFWNRGTERLTGIAADSVLHSTWSPGLIGMRDEKVGNWNQCDCPIAYCLATGIQSLRRLLVANRSRRPVAVDVQTIPVVSGEGFMHGAAMLLHDVSGEASLEQQCQNLQERASTDPLTQVANRAQFDQSYQTFVHAHLEQKTPCSLIICDIDHFKRVNDTYGHQAGDEVLRNFGHLLKSECRPGDLVARYGGEEFVALCADCNIATAARRAEHLRKSIGELPQPALHGRGITVSFGVTEIQPGDTPDSMLRRADRALLDAKQSGRNTVVQLGNGQAEEAEPAAVGAEPRPCGELCLQRALQTTVPLNVAIEKLRGFVLDHHAEILAINADRVDLQIEVQQKRPARRRSDRAIPFLVELTLSEQRREANGGRGASRHNHTRVGVVVRLKRARDQKNANVAEQAVTIMIALKSYLMATEETQPAEPGSSHRAINLLPWLKGRS